MIYIDFSVEFFVQNFFYSCQLLRYYRIFFFFITNQISSLFMVTQTLWYYNLSIKFVFACMNYQGFIQDCFFFGYTKTWPLLEKKNPQLTMEYSSYVHRMRLQCSDNLTSKKENYTSSFFPPPTYNMPWNSDYLWTKCAIK